MKNRALSLWIVLVMLTVLPVYGQAQSMKWGKVSMEDLQMTTYEADTNAVAVILGEYGEIKVDQTGDTNFNYHLRVKLLSESAYDNWGTYRLFYNKGQLKERIRNVEGFTHVLDATGKPVRHKLGKKSIFKEKIDGDIEAIRFTLPALEPGAIVEFKYKQTSETPVVLPDWTFQHGEPTRWSELRADISEYFDHVRISTVPKFTIEEQEKNPVPGERSVIYRWAMNDVPALREEPYVTTIEDYRLKMEFQLASYYHPNFGTTNYMRSWNELASELRSIGDFGRAFKNQKNVRKRAEEITAGIDSPKDRMIAIYRYVRANHAWNGDYGFVPDRGLSDVLKSERASSPEQVLLMVALMRAVELEANPVLISTRRNGQVKKVYPIFSQFNYLIAHVDVGGEEFLLDATEWNGPYNVLAERALNNAGWMVTEKSHRWIPVSSNAKHTQLISLDGKLTPDGSGAFDMTSSSMGYRALELRNALDEADEDAFVQDHIIEKTGDFEVREIAISNVDSLLNPLNVNAGVKMPNFGSVAGDFIYFNPHAVSTWEENPLRLPKRTFPVDLGYPRDEVYNIRLELPEGYVVHEQPQNMNLKLPEKGGAFRRTCVVDGNILIVQSRFTLSKSSYSPAMYQNLRELYDRVVAAQAEQVVLKKIADAGH